MNADSFNIGNIEFNSEIYGPGKRTVIWFQGCTIGCKGCWNTQFQSTLPAMIVHREDLLSMIIEKKNNVTFLGGEPLLQKTNLKWLIDELKNNDVHIMLYTGYELNEIDEDPDKKYICQKVDILIPGRYVDSLRDTNLTWRGSKNQPIIYLTQNEEIENTNQAEIRIEKNGSVTCLGYPNESLSDFIRSLDYKQT